MKIIELQYLPQPKYFALLFSGQDVLIDKYEHFVKQTYRNRCRILTANGIDELSIPVIGAGQKTSIKEIKIDRSQKWVNRHWRAIQSAYGKAPYFEFYADELRSIFYKKHKFLFDLTLDFLTQCLEFLQYKDPIKFTDNYYELTDTPQNDLRSLILPKSNTKLPISYNQVVYQQVFGSKFVDNLSVIDLIFSEGPRAGEILKSGIIIEHK
ncbi:MAG: WbqC family protein [Bacteroidota bacterium]